MTAWLLYQLVPVMAECSLWLSVPNNCESLFLYYLKFCFHILHRGYFKLPKGLNMSADACSSLRCPCDRLAVGPGCTPPPSEVSWNWLQFLCDPDRSVTAHGWVDKYFIVNLVLKHMSSGVRKHC